jgi:hypothetical protein
MRIGPIVFYWRQRPGLWVPKRIHEDQTRTWFEDLQADLEWAGCNLVIVQPWHRYHGQPGLKRHMEVVTNYPRFDVMPYIDRYAFKVEEPIPDPAHDLDTLVDFWYEWLRPVPWQQWRRRDGRRCLGMIGNFIGGKHLHPDSIARLEKAIGEKYFDDVPAMICLDRKMANHFAGDRVQCNLFRHGYHSWYSAPTVAVRPGYFHGHDYPEPDRRYVPRRGGDGFRLALRRALANPLIDEIDIESWNERTEHSNIEPCRPRPKPENVEQVPEGEHWGRGARRYLKIIKREVERWEETSARIALQDST